MSLRDKGSMRFVVVAGCAAIVAVAFSSAVRGDNSQKQADEIRLLSQQRIETLHSVYDTVVKLYERGSADSAAVHEAQIEYFRAAVAGAANKAERVDLLRKIVQEAEKHEEIVEAQQQAAQATQVDKLRAHAFTLECKIALAQAEMGS